MFTSSWAIHSVRDRYAVAAFVLSLLWASLIAVTLCATG